MAHAVEVEHADGGFGGAPGIEATIEETALATEALAGRAPEAAARGAAWLAALLLGLSRLTTPGGAAVTLAGIAGLMQFSRLTVGDPTVAGGLELDVIAAVVIGGGSLSGGQGSIAGSLIGALIMAFLRNGCQQMGWANYIQEIIIGVVIVLAVALDRARANWAERSAALALLLWSIQPPACRR